MRSVWKLQYNLFNGTSAFRVPVGAKVIHVNRDPAIPANEEFISIWIDVDTDAPMEEISFDVRGTGHPVIPDAEYVGSVIAPPYAWHVFKVT